MSITAKTIQAVGITARSIIAKTIQVYSDFIQYCRYVSNFNGTTSYAEFTNDIVLSGDFKLSVWFFANDTGGAYERAILGNDSAGTIISVLSDRRIKLVADTSYSFAAGLSNLGEWNHLEVDVSTGSILVTLNSVVIRNEAFSDQLTLNLIGDSAASPSRDFNGQIKDLIIEDNSTLLVDLPMDETSETSTVNYVNRTGNTDYNATGYNITTTQECVTIPANTVFVDGVPVTDEDGEYVTA